MLIGYARVSTADQTLDLQEDALGKAGCSKIFTDTASGAKAERIGLDEALSHLREGDTLVVWRLDRLGRSQLTSDAVLQNHLAANNFVMRTDVKSFYASIDHLLLMERLAFHIGDRRILSLLGQYLRRTVEQGGCLVGALFLDELDRRMEQSGAFYVRFMDDIVVLAPSRWKLRRAVKAVNEVLDGLRLEKHPDKTVIGRIERGFDFLGYHFSRTGLAVAKATLATFVERATRLYERDWKEPTCPSRLGRYVRRWVGWAEWSAIVRLVTPPLMSHREPAGAEASGAHTGRPEAAGEGSGPFRRGPPRAS